MAVMFWYFAIVDFDWYIDDALAGANLDEQQLEAARESMQAMSPSSFKWFGMGGSAFALLGFWILLLAEA